MMPSVVWVSAASELDHSSVLSVRFLKDETALPNLQHALDRPETPSRNSPDIPAPPSDSDTAALIFSTSLTFVMS